MDNHYFNEHGEFCFTAPVNPQTTHPVDALRVAPPEIPEGSWPILNKTRDGWSLAEDHRGRRGWVNDTETVIERVGSLPEGWSETPPVPPDVRTPEQKRQDAYVLEVDPLRKQAAEYQDEAEGWRLLGDLDKAAAAEEKARQFLVAAVEKKEEIRSLHSDAESVAQAAAGMLSDTGHHEEEGGNESGHGQNSESARYCLNASGVYHAALCASVSESGQWLTLTEIAVASPDARPCSRCAPPALAANEEEETSE